jgi:hypothetical protein
MNNGPTAWSVQLHWAPMESRSGLEERTHPTTCCRIHGFDVSLLNTVPEALHLRSVLNMGSSIAYSVAARSGVSNSPRMSAYHHSSVQAPPHGFSYHHVEQHSRPGTPSMTTGSSWSAASSVNTCEDCRNSTQKCCGCQSDAESGRWQNSELG